MSLKCSVLSLSVLGEAETTQLINRSKPVHVIVPTDVPYTGPSVSTIQTCAQFTVHRTGVSSNRMRDRFTDVPTLCQLTSGSTSASSKISIRTWDGILEEGIVIEKWLSMVPEDAVYINAGISHSYGLVGGALSSILAGSTLVMLLAMDHLPMLPTNCPPPTLLYGIRSTYLWLLDNLSPIDLSSTRHALSAGASFPEDLKQSIAKKHNIDVRQDYGTTETGTITIDTDTSPTSSSRLGQVLPHLEFKISSSTLGIDQLLVRSSTSVSQGYITDTDITPATDADNWFHTSDNVVIIGNNTLPRPTIAYNTRIRLIKTQSGEHIDPSVIEQSVLSTFSTTVDTAVLMPNLRLLIQPRPLQTPDLVAIQQHLLSKHPVSSTAFIVDTVNSFPYSPAGKLLHKYIVNDKPTKNE
eukprot:gene20698-24857_t